MAADRAGDFGSKLRAARERRGVTLRQIADATKISVALLDALERNDISRLPGGIFSRSFVRAYAVEVGLDPDQAIEEFIAQFPHDGVAAGHGHAQQVEDNEAIESERRMATAFLKVIAISLPLAGVLLYFSSSRRAVKPPEGQAQAPAATSPLSTRGGAEPAAAATSLTMPPGPVAPAVVPAGRSATPNPVPSSGAPAVVRPAPTPAAAPSSAVTADRASAVPSPTSGEATTAQERVTVEIVATGLCSVTAVIDGRPTAEQMMSAGERQTFLADRELRLKIGDASAITWTVNGKPARTLGGPGHVANVHLTPSNVGDYVAAP
jgi:cytoskeletal protein RodZ